MKRIYLALAVSTAAGAALWLASPLRAADHADSPVHVADVEADIADIYAFTNDSASKVSLIMTFGRGAAGGSDFATDTDYIFNLTSSEADGSGAQNYTLTCTFPTGQTVSCALEGGDLSAPVSVTGDVAADLCSGSGGGGGCDGDLRVYADIFDDPFFFNLDGFEATVEAVRSAASGLSFSNLGCPVLDADTAEALVDCLGTACDDFGNSSSPAQNAFAGENVRGIVVQLTRDSIDGGGDRLAFWATTEVAGTQLDRMGRPAVSTALIGTFRDDSTARGALKDAYNAAPNRSSWNFGADIEASLAILDALNSTGK